MPYKDYEYHKKQVSKRVIEWRRRTKLRAIEYLGGKCQKCGYDKCVRALAFHHLDASQKEFGISAKGLSRAWDKIVVELDKCILLCHNCHMEEHCDDSCSISVPV